MDKETRDLLLALTREVAELSTLVKKNLEDDNDKEQRLRKVERWMYAIPVAYILTLGSMVATYTRTSGKS